VTALAVLPPSQRSPRKDNALLAQHLGDQQRPQHVSKTHQPDTGQDCLLNNLSYPPAFHICPPALWTHQSLAGGSPCAPESLWVLCPAQTCWWLHFWDVNIWDMVCPSVHTSLLVLSLFWKAKTWPWKESLVEADKSTRGGKPTGSNYWNDVTSVGHDRGCWQ